MRTLDDPLFLLLWLCLSMCSSLQRLHLLTLCVCLLPPKNGALESQANFEICIRVNSVNTLPTPCCHSSLSLGRSSHSVILYPCTGLQYREVCVCVYQPEVVTTHKTAALVFYIIYIVTTCCAQKGISLSTFHSDSKV